MRWRTPTETWYLVLCSSSRSVIAAPYTLRLAYICAIRLVLEDQRYSWPTMPVGTTIAGSWKGAGLPLQ